jgi:hypothetical protein
MKARILILSLAVLLCQLTLLSTAQTPICAFDLRLFGMQVPQIQLVFLSSSRLLIIFDDGRHIAVLDTTNGRLLKNKGFPNATGSIVQRISDQEFAIAEPTGIAICNADLECRPGPTVNGRFSFSPDGKLFILGPALPPSSTDWREMDLQGATLSRYMENPYNNAIPTSAGIFFGSAGGLRFYATGSNTPKVLTKEPAANFGTVDDSDVLFLSGRHYQPTILSISGTEKYKLNLEELPGLPWDAAVVRSVEGQVFGLEWKANTTRQLLTPLACVDECPPPGIQSLAVYSSNEGKLIRKFSWDPRPWNLYVKPALSPDGKLAAVVEGTQLKVYPI